MTMLDGKVAIVTGASRGIGQAIAELFASQGARVVVAARTLNEGEHRSLEGSLTRTVAAIKAAGGEAIACRTDLSSEADCTALIETTQKTYGSVDILINNAALTYYIPLEQYPTSRWMRCFSVNVHAPFILSREVLKYFIPKCSGAIVNISSRAAIGPGRGPYGNEEVQGSVMYGASKAALERITQGLAQEVGRYGGITVAAVSPSQVVTTPGTIYHKIVTGPDDPEAEPPNFMARAVLLLVTKGSMMNGRVTYSQEILKEFGMIENAIGHGVDLPGSGYSRI